MSLKQSIVIVSEFTFKTKSGGGSRGATPGAYAYDYMARGDAVEPLTPVKLHAMDAQDSIYRAREEARSQSESLSDLKTAFREAKQSGGVAFGYNHVSLPHDELVRACDDIQKQFDDGKTVFKTVLSFDEEYLKSLGVVQDGFEHSKKGDYRGHVDQMKLRMAVMSGLDKLSDRGFDDLCYVGAIQVDTNHVHCHLAMVDRGEGRVINSKTGAQKGKLSKDDFDVIRKGVDSYLHQHAVTMHFSPSVYDDSRNVQCYVKGYTHELMHERALPQFLVACLPEDRTLWRAGNPSAVMRKPNAIVREYVESILARPGSGYNMALHDLSTRLSGQRERFDMSDSKYQELYRSGQKRIVMDCMDSVYQVLRQAPEQDLRVRTPMLARMSSDFESMAAKIAGSHADPVSEFGFRLRMYSGRQDFHRKETVKYHSAVASYESSGNITQAAMPVLDFMRFEEEYNAMLLAKYQHFMSFMPSSDRYEIELRKLREQKSLLARFEAAKQDERLFRMTVEKAEQYGCQQYRLVGCGLAIADPAGFLRRGENLRNSFTQNRQSLSYNLGLQGLSLITPESESDKFLIQKSVKYAFDDVKALDLHHLQYDFGYDVDVSRPNIDTFLNAAKQRVELFQQASDYLTQSGQADQIRQFAVRDIQKMSETAESLQVFGKLPAAALNHISDKQRVSRSRMTLSLDVNYDDIMTRAVQERLNYQVGNDDV